MPVDLTCRLKGKSILVIGGGGIGNELALRYAREGASVVLADKEEAVAEAGAKSLGDGPGRIIPISCEATDIASLQQAVDLAVSRFGGLDGMHANFAAFLDGALPDGALDLPLDIYDRMSEVNARGFLLATRAALPAIIDRGGGSIIYTSSGSAYMGEPVRVAYAMTKSAGHALMRHVARRYGENFVRANTIAPGIVMHPALAEKAGEHLEKWAFSVNAYKKRIGTPADIAALGALLMSDEGAYITGQVISVDGGGTMRA